MGILVCYDDFTYDVVSDIHLDDMINAGRVTGFDSSCRWVKTEHDPLQETKSSELKEAWHELTL
jgi:hypothetical protein